MIQFDEQTQGEDTLDMIVEDTNNEDAQGSQGVGVHGELPELT